VIRSVTNDFIILICFIFMFLFSYYAFRLINVYYYTNIRTNKLRKIYIKITPTFYILLTVQHLDVILVNGQLHALFLNVFIIIIGGILVLFIYITRLASNEIFSPSNKLQRQKILMFVHPIYKHNWRNIITIYIYIISLASNEIFSPSNKIHREVGRAKDLSAPLYN
jgi:hypothetical protein